ncbi:nuclear transport factor 2 family protein [Pasteurella sp. PK-2025]|uniref:nuclear transport factor 2 family protein n=1 Tax=Pasteurella sp. PK-2025 TaxID=3413133 RepID=UPI003C7559BA
MSEETLLQQREERIRLWFEMWLQQQDLGIDQIFTPEVTYIESWGPKYTHRTTLKHWFTEWNRRGKVLRWDIKDYFHKDNQTIVQWSFCDHMHDGRCEAFDGMSLIKWSEHNQIDYVQEFGCHLEHYDPYEQDANPHYRSEKKQWF